MSEVSVRAEGIAPPSSVCKAEVLLLDDARVSRAKPCEATARLAEGRLERADHHDLRPVVTAPRTRIELATPRRQRGRNTSCATGQLHPDQRDASDPTFGSRAGPKAPNRLLSSSLRRFAEQRFVASPQDTSVSFVVARQSCLQLDGTTRPTSDSMLWGDVRGLHPPRLSHSQLPSLGG